MCAVCLRMQKLLKKRHPITSWLVAKHRHRIHARALPDEEPSAASRGGSCGETGARLWANLTFDFCMPNAAGRRSREGIVRNNQMNVCRHICVSCHASHIIMCVQSHEKDGGTPNLTLTAKGSYTYHTVVGVCGTLLYIATSIRHLSLFV